MAKSKVDFWLTSDGLTLLKGWARDGLTNEQIAHNMSIGNNTFYKYINKYEEIRETLKKSKDIVDYEVENALYKRALGYKYTEITKFKSKDERGQEVIKVTEVTKEIPPDTGACMAWLKNRRTDKWRDKPDRKDEEVLAKLDKLLEEQKNA